MSATCQDRPPSAALGQARPGAFPPTAIAIPARDEGDYLPGCLLALAQQRGPAAAPFDYSGVTVLVLANGCTDATADIARAMAPALPFRLEVREVTLPPRLAHAGGARRTAMDAAAAHLERQRALPRAALLSTDADGRAGPHWLAANLAALAAGADAVAGAIEPDPVDARRLPACLRRREAQEARYAALLDEIAALVDPDPNDPWPRHAAHSGASIALTLEAYRRIGGLPAVPSGEDRALFEALMDAEMRVRHCPTARVTVSCRLDGRAAGGMADTLRQRLAEAGAAPLDPGLEPATDALRRLRCRRALRRLRAGQLPAREQQRLARWLGLDPLALAGCAGRPGFRQAWAELQRLAVPLRDRRQLRLRDLGGEIGRAKAILRALRRRLARLPPAEIGA